jgi:hypothetical protein
VCGCNRPVNVNDTDPRRRVRSAKPSRKPRPGTPIDRPSPASALRARSAPGPGPGQAGQETPCHSTATPAHGVKRSRGLLHRPWMCGGYAQHYHPAPIPGPASVSPPRPIPIAVPRYRYRCGLDASRALRSACSRSSASISRLTFSDIGWTARLSGTACLS